MVSEELNVTNLMFLKSVTFSIVDSQINLSKDRRIQSRGFKINKGTAFKITGASFKHPLLRRPYVERITDDESHDIYIDP